MEVELRDHRKVEIRALCAQDFASFNLFREQIARETSHTLRYPGQPPMDEASTVANWSNSQRTGHSLHLGAFDQNHVIGFLLCYRPYPEHPHMLHLGHFAMMTLKEYWGSGVAQQLLHELDLFAQRRDLLKMEATVRTDNPRALTLYQRAGYHIEGVRRRAARIDQEFRDEYFIAKFY